MTLWKQGIPHIPLLHKPDNDDGEQRKDVEARNPSHTLLHKPDNDNGKHRKYVEARNPSHTLLHKPDTGWVCFVFAGFTWMVGFLLNLLFAFWTWASFCEPLFLVCLELIDGV